MSKKGVSFEDKKARLIQIFHEKKEFFQLKELEKLAKEKGVTVNSVKDVIQALVDDGTVDTDKIAGSIYFWSFPSKVIKTKKRKLEELQNSYETSTKKLKLTNENLSKQNTNKENIDDANDVIKDLGKLEQCKNQLEKEIKLRLSKNPVNIEEMEKQILPIKEAANRWTDNIFAIKAWCKKKFMLEDKVLNKQFGIPEDLDYIE